VYPVERKQHDRWARRKQVCKRLTVLRPYLIFLSRGWLKMAIAERSVLVGIKRLRRYGSGFCVGAFEDYCGWRGGCRGDRSKLGACLFLRGIALFMQDESCRGCTAF